MEPHHVYTLDSKNQSYNVLIFLQDSRNISILHIHTEVPLKWDNAARKLGAGFTGFCPEI